MSLNKTDNVPARGLQVFSSTLILAHTFVQIIYHYQSSFQTSALYYGNYISQERVRYAAGNTELLLGANELQVADNLRLTYSYWDAYANKVSTQIFSSDK